MATKNYTLKLNVESATISELERELEDINQGLKDVDRNSAAFDGLAKASQRVTGELEKVNNAVEGFTLEDKLELTDGAIKVMGGSLNTVVGAMGALGVETEAFGKIQEKAMSVIALTTGLKDMTEGMGKLGKGFKKSGVASKLFGGITKKALIATGIGAFVVLIGTMIAYWDDIKKAVDKAGGSFNFIGSVLDTVGDKWNYIVEAARPYLSMLGLMDSAAEVATKKISSQAKTRSTALEREIKEMKLRGIAQEEIFAKEQELLDQKILAETDAQAKSDLIHDKKLANIAEEVRLKKEADDQMAADAQAKADNEAAEAAKKKTADEEAAAAQKEKDDEAAEEKAEKEEAERVKKEEEEAVRIEKEKEVKAQQLAEEEELANRKITTQQKVDQAKANALNNVIALAGRESAIGRAALVGKQILAAKELMINAKKTLQNVATDASESGVAVTKGFAKTLAKGFPNNVPLLIAYAAQAAGIFGAIKSAVGKAKSTVKGGGGVSMPSQPSIPSGGRSIAPVNQPQQEQQDLSATNDQTVTAVVVSGDVRSAQEADAKVRARRTLGT